MGWMPYAVGGGAAASLLSGWMGANAASGAASEQSTAALQAAEIQAQSTKAQLAQQQAQWQQNQNNQAPWVQQGQSAGSTLSADMAPGGALSHQFNASDLNANLAPNYQFQLQQGNQALQASQSAGGTSGAGQGLKDVSGYNQNLAGNAYQQAFNNYTTNQTNLYNRLQGISSLGENAAANVGNQGTQMSTNIANSMQAGTTASNNYLTGAASATAAGQVGSANAWSGAVGTGINSGLTMGYLSGLQNEPGSNLNYNSPYTAAQMQGFYTPSTP